MQWIMPFMQWVVPKMILGRTIGEPAAGAQGTLMCMGSNG